MLFGTRYILMGLVFIALCVHPSIALASPDFEQQLQTADSLRTTNPKAFEEILQKLDAEAASATPDQMERLGFLQAYKFAYSGQYNLAIEKASAIFSDSKNVSTKYRAGLLMTNTYATTRDYISGFAVLDKTLALQEKIHDPVRRHEGLNIAALIYNQVGQYELGKNYAEMILADEPSPRMQCMANSLLLEAEYNLKSLPENDSDIDAMIDSCSEHKEVLMANYSRGFLARKWADQGEIKKAISFLEQHVPEIDSLNYQRLSAEIHSLLAKYYLADGAVAQAELHATTSIRQSAATPFSLPLVSAEKTLYDIAMLRADETAAFNHYKKYAEADKAYLTDIKARELAFQVVKQDTQQKIQTINLLNEKNEVLQLEQTVAKQQARYTAILVGMLALLLTILLLWTYRTKRMQLAFQRLAETDALTGISNRDHFTKLAEQAIFDASKKSESLGMIMFDLDNFKSINDRFGHSTGDWVLKQVIAACKPICRKQDCFGRIGGEEFAILLHASELSSAAETAERFRKQIAAIDTSETGHDLSVTASFGVTSAQLSGYVFDTLLSHADQALYQSKREGRNRVSTYDKLRSNADIVGEAAIRL